MKKYLPHLASFALGFAVAVMLLGRYQIIAAPGTVGHYVVTLDRLTGQMNCHLLNP